MTSAFTTIATDDLTLFTQGDEAALERIFRTEYDALVAHCAAELEDPSAAPRIVEGAFYDAWQRRASFTSPGELALFLRETVHREALRERSRRAALHRFHEHEGAAGAHGAHGAHPAPPPQPPRTVSASEAWSALLGALRAPPPDSVHGAEVRHDVSRHEAASHVAKVAAPEDRTRGLILMAAVAAIVLVFIFGMMRWMGAANPVARVDAALARGEPRIVSTHPAQRATVPLSDGSHASLAPDSDLRIPKDYGRSIRALGLEGAARFTVAEAGHPFFVRAGSALVQATGTIFDVSTFSDSGTIVRVREGTVTVMAGDSTRDVAAGAALAVASNGSMSTPAAAVLNEAMGWTDGRFVVVDRPMSEMPALIQRWYGLQVAVGDSALADRHVSLEVPLDSTRQMITALEKAAQATYVFQGEARYFRDAAPRR